MSEATKTEKIDVKEARIEKLETKVNAMARILDKLIHRLEAQFGEDYNADGVIGAGKKVVGVLLAVLLCAGGVFAEDIANWSDGSGLSGTAKVSHDGTDFTLEIDNVSADGVIDGVPVSGTVATNATTAAAVSAAETYGQVNKTVLTATALPVSVIYNGGATNAIGSTKIYDFPEGRILVLGVTVDSFDIVSYPTNTMDDADGGDFSFGTAVPGADGTLDGTAVDLCPSTSIDPITNVVSAALAASAQFDGTTTAKDAYAILSIDHGDLTGASTNAVTVNFTKTIHWINLGDY